MTFTIDARNAQGARIGATMDATGAQNAAITMRHTTRHVAGIDGFTVGGFGIVRVHRDRRGRFDGGFTWLDPAFGFLTGDYVDLANALGGGHPSEKITRCAQCGQRAGAIDRTDGTSIAIAPLDCGEWICGPCALAHPLHS